VLRDNSHKMIAGQQLRKTLTKGGKLDTNILFHLDWRALASEPSNTSQIDCCFSAGI
jgi:hypothetical protein